MVQAAYNFQTVYLFAIVSAMCSTVTVTYTGKGAVSLNVNTAPL